MSKKAAPMSYDNHRSKGIDFWRTFLRQCYVVQMELRSLTYLVYGVYFQQIVTSCFLNHMTLASYYR
jgi:hypothetical protein